MPGADSTARMNQGKRLNHRAANPPPTTTSSSAAAVYESLGSKVGYTEQVQEVTQWFAAAALVLVVVGGGLAALWFNRFP